ncbi:hypothetical protein BVX97_01905 [bacterium E08(2017)]|nr:hypothetical protein BVX97_01905 [bacterium E08(2017)]
MSPATWIAVAVAVVIGFFIVSVYNKLVALRNRFKNAFAQIDVQLKRRYDLIPNLVETAKKYLEHEKETLVKLTEARAGAMDANQKAAANPADPDAMKVLVQAEQGLMNALGGLRVAVEAYPDLKANQTMETLMEELTSTENKIAFSRQAYNDSVTLYNTSTEMFPSNIIANMFSFKQAVLLEAEEKEREAVKVEF